MNKGHLEKLPFRPISASQENEKCSHMTNMLRFLIFLFLGVYAYLTSNENSNFSRHPKKSSIRIHQGQRDLLI